MLLFWLLACTITPRDPAAVLALTGDPAKGASELQTRCARCHGMDGRGTAVAPDLGARVPVLSDQQVVETMLLGRGSMRPVAIFDQQAADVLGHLRGRWPQEPTAEEPQREGAAAPGDITP